MSDGIFTKDEQSCNIIQVSPLGGGDMGIDGYKIENIGGSIYVLVRAGQSVKDSKLFHRMKKDKQAIKLVYLMLDKLSEFEYKDLIPFCFEYRILSKIKGVKGIQDLRIQVLEVHIRDPLTSNKQKTKWRLLATCKDGIEKLVLVDSFQNHQGKSLAKEVADRIDDLRIIEKILEKGTENGT